MRITEDPSIDLEEIDTDIHPSIRNDDHLPIVTSQLRDDHTPISHEGVKKEIEGKLNQSILDQELDHFDMYLHNIHKVFPMATSVGALLKLTDGALRIHKHRRSTIEHAMKLRKEESGMPRFDAMGNEIKD